MRSILCAAFISVGCAGSEPAPAPPAVDSAVVVDSGTGDSVVTIDSSSVDSAASDSYAPDAATDTSTCAYANVDDVVVKCGEKYTMLGYFNVVPASASCPPYWAFAGKTPHATKEDAIAAAGCSATCVYTFFQSITRLYCGKKSGYEVLRATDCADVYRFAEGYFPSVEAHDAAHPCPA